MNNVEDIEREESEIYEKRLKIFGLLIDILYTKDGDGWYILDGNGYKNHLKLVVNVIDNGDKKLLNVVIFGLSIFFGRFRHRDKN